MLIFHYIQKTSFWADFGHLWPKNPGTRSFSNNQAPSFFRSDGTLKLCAKNQKISVSGFEEKRRTNGQTDKWSNG